MKRFVKILLGAVIAVGLLTIGLTIWGMSELDRYEKMTPEQRAVEQAEYEARQEEAARQNLVEHADGQHCLGSSGQHSAFVDYFRDQLRDPDSFQHVRTVIHSVDDEGQHRLRMTYRARNGFGGMNVETVQADVANRDCSFRLIAD